ncbi:uncharacterized protein L969DRAFT_96378 [Mixia osmundae IAM 14324]|uniref:YCII-related domain-containing protein n=1 Tax=Mixia osmundae (strain CBS 9802 / IAM 14324 / JCM 22182 / KY 12970) TaxID=764103 RepID=G7DWD4_MIXOS|nr:uncharacterized protein L969DRAFT_96378 [Mixia osmundae IAM 14324]KEI37294.1 hypothetical protein L969DRAFT_96378 [Mixia osmundae IAM 14324]GAA94894.1 hypothetical protein E5Q_01549 [Mixia osmundae IAM 14324]
MSSSGTNQQVYDEQLGDTPEYYYLCTCPDLKDSKRMNVRAQHFEGVEAAHKNGHLPFAGAMLSDDPAKNDAAKMIGSVMIYRARSIEDARRKLESDIYVSGQAWDIARTTIQPIRVPPIFLGKQ